MKVLSAPWSFATGSLLDPNKVNENFNYFADANLDVFSKRYTKSMWIYPYYRDLNNGYTQADARGVRSYEYRALVNTWFEHLYLDGALSNGSAQIYVYDVATGQAPANVVNPILSASVTEATDIFAQELMIPSGSTYRFELSGSGTWTTSKLDLVVHARTDRFYTGSADVFRTPTINQLSERDAVDAEAYNILSSSLKDVVRFNSQQTATIKPMFFVKHDISSSVDINRVRTYIPRTDSTDTNCTAIRMTSFYAANTAFTGVLNFALRDQNFANTSLSSSINNAGNFSGSSVRNAAVVLSSAQKGIQSTGSLDYSFVMHNSGSTLTKMYSYIWLL